MAANPDVPNPSPSTKALNVKAKDVHVGDRFEGCQVVHKETIGDKGIVLLTLGSAKSDGRRAWRWSNEMVDVHRRVTAKQSFDH